MNKVEFLKELEGCLKNKVEDKEVEEILSAHRTQFDIGIAEGKMESAIAVEIGAPALVAKRILNIKQEEELKLQAREPEELATMGNRLLAYCIDGIILNLVLILIIYIIGIAIATLKGSTLKDLSFVELAPMMIFIVVAGVSNVLESIILCKTNGYTPGKWMLKIRVEKKNRSVLTYGDCFIREVIVKCLGSTFTSGLLNVFSFIWGFVTPEKKTVQDLVASTRVIKILPKN